MALIDKATTMEQSRNMYSLNSGLIYWMEWAEAFIKQCEDLGWEVVVGPGTSLGAVMLGASITSSNFHYYYYSVPDQSCGWDCDWTQKDGIYYLWKSENDKYNNYPKYTGWFKDFETWPSGANEKGIDKSTGRFDFVIYTGEGNSGEKIGFRIKYPVCSIGYSFHSNSTSGVFGCGNYIYASPMISLYSSHKGDIGNYYPTNPSSTDYNADSDANNYDSKFKGYVYLFGKRPYRSPSVFNDSSFWRKTDKDNTRYTQLSYEPTDIAESPLWSLELQASDAFSIDPFSSSNLNTLRLFKYNWYKYNKFHYHVSQTGDTVYMYVSDDSGNIGFKLITTTLESGEKAIIMERRNSVEDGILCEMAAVTGSPTNNPSQPEDDYLIRLPKRPYVKHNSGTGKFSLSRMLIPTQLSLCKDLYYVTKRDIDKSIGNGQYVWIKDKKTEKHCFRIIPFGSTSAQETLGDNTTYLAFPVKDPPEQEEEI